MLRLVVTAVLLVACGHPKARDHGDRCSSIAPSVYLAGEGTSGGPREQAVLAAITSACRTDNWTPEVMGCFPYHTDGKADYEVCTGQMTERQRANLEHAFEAGKESGGEHSPDVTDAVSPPAQSSGFSCFSWYNTMSQSTETICSDDCESQRTGLQKQFGKVISNVTACESTATVWCFTASNEQMCQPTQEKCQQKHDSPRFEGASPSDCAAKP